MGTNGTHRSHTRYLYLYTLVQQAREKNPFLPQVTKNMQILRRKRISTVGNNFLTTGAIQVRMGVMQVVCEACFEKVEKRLFKKLHRNYCCYV